MNLANLVILTKIELIIVYFLFYYFLSVTKHGILPCGPSPRFPPRFAL